MKKIIAVILFSMVLLSGCGSPNWQAKIEKSSQFENGKAVSVTVSVIDNGNPVSGLQIKGTLEMQKMDHGKIPVEFTEHGKGIYECTTKLPMGGDWVADLQMNKGNGRKEQVVNFKVGQAQAAKEGMGK